MFFFEVFGILTASYLVIKHVGEAVVEIRNEGYGQKRLAEEGRQEPEDAWIGRRPKLDIFRPGR